MDHQFVAQKISEIDKEQLWNLAKEFDRLTGSNVCRKGPQMLIEIDKACGKLDENDKKFCEFVVDMIQRLPPP